VLHFAITNVYFAYRCLFCIPINIFCFHYIAVSEGMVAEGDIVPEISATEVENIILVPKSAIPIGSYVAVGYGSKWYPGLVERVSKDCGESGDGSENVDELLVKFMQIKGINKFCWPKRDDMLSVPCSDVLCVLSPPHQCKRFVEFDKLDFANANAAFEQWQ